MPARAQGLCVSDNCSMKTSVSQSSSLVSIPSTIVAWKQKNIPSNSEKKIIEKLSQEMLQKENSLGIPEFRKLWHLCKSGDATYIGCRA